MSWCSQGPKPEEKPATSSGGSATDAKPTSSSSASGASTEKVSTDKYRNYAVLAGTITVFASLGWYLKGTAKKPEVQDWGYCALTWTVKKDDK